MTNQEKQTLNEMCVAIEHNANNVIKVGGLEIDYYNFEENVIEDDDDNEVNVLTLVFGIEGGDIIFNDIDITSIIKEESGWRVKYIDTDSNQEQHMFVQVFQPV